LRIPIHKVERDRDVNDVDAYNISRGGMAPQFTPEVVAHHARAGTLTPAMRTWARWDMQPGLTDVRLFGKPQATRWQASYGSKTLDLTDDYYAVDTLDGATMEMHQSIASDGPLAHICNFYTELVMGTGFRAELERIPQPGDKVGEAPPEPSGEELEAIMFLAAADMHPGSTGSGLWPSLFSAVGQLVKLTTVYHRACIVKHMSVPGGKAMEWGGKERKSVPQGLEVVHPRDLGMVGLNRQKVPVSIYRNMPFDRLDLDSLIYVSSALEGCHVHNSAGYGLSPMSGCVDAARLYDKVEKEDLPAVTRVSWTKIPLIFVNMPGGDPARKRAALARLAGLINGGGPTLVGLDPESVKVEDIKMDPIVAELDQLKSTLLNYMAAHMNLPQVMVGEKDTTRASSSAKSNLMIQGSIQPRRVRLGEILAAHWYMPMLRAEYPEVAKKWRVRVVFDNLDTESLAQKVEAINAIDASRPLTDGAYGRMLNIQGFEAMVDQKERERRHTLEETIPKDTSGAPAKGGPNPASPGRSRRNVPKPDEVNAK